MSTKIRAGGLLLALAAVVPLGISAHAFGQEAKAPKVVSDQSVAGFQFPESVACDARSKALYMQSRLRFVRLAVQP